MSDFLISAYPWIKSLHIISVISWMVAMLYMPRLFVYHTERGPAGSDVAETFEIMERRLFRGIMTPAMVAAWVFGLALLMTPGIVDLAQDHWFHVKAVCILAMTAIHLWLGRQRKIFAAGQNRHSSRFYRILNEVPAVLMFVIVIMVIVRPF